MSIYQCAVAVTIISIVIAASPGCGLEANMTHSHLRTWQLQICDGRGGNLHLLRQRTYYTLLARSLLSDDPSIRLSSQQAFRTSVCIPGRRYFYLLDAYVDGCHTGMLEKCLRESLHRSPLDSNERLRILQCLIELQMRHYLWGQPGFAKHLMSMETLLPPHRGFSTFWPNHYPVFAERLATENDAKFVKDWEQFREVMRQLYGRDPADKK